MTTSSKKSVSKRSTNAGLASIVTEISAALDKAEARLGSQPPAITSTEKRRTSKPRKGAERVLAVLAPIVQQHGLDSPSLSSTMMLDRVDTAQTLLPLQTRMQRLLKRVDDELFSAQSDAWSMGLQFYSLLQRRAKSDGDLAQNLEPIARVFAYRHDSAKVGKPTKLQTRAKAKLKEATALAERHGIIVESAPPAPTAVAAPAPAAPTQAPAPAPVVAPVAAPVVTAPPPIAVAPVVVAAAAPVAPPVGASNGIVTNGSTNGAAPIANGHA